MRHPTRARVLVLHRGTGRAFTYNEDYELLEPLILGAGAPSSYRSVRCWWKPPCKAPAWAARVRDHEFDTYWV